MYFNSILFLAYCCLVFHLDKCLVYADVDFAFEEEIYAHVIKSTQKTLKPVFHIKTPHCRYGAVAYSLYNSFGPFKVNYENGSIYLAHTLDANGPNRYIFNIRAKDANGLCSATAEIQIYIVHVNEHKPIMSAAKYHCKVYENERTVEVTPAIYATDKDEGPAGIIQAIHIREQGIPFKVEMEEDGRAKLVVDADLDAESMVEYYFSIYAVDNGTRARKSERSRVYCEVVDVNEFSPVFRHPRYFVSVQRGKTYENIMQLEAIDRDISNKMGKICNYAVVESNVPFDVDRNGILSLPSPLSGKDPSYIEFHVKATDCGSMDSDDDAVVRVTVKDLPITATHSSPLKMPGCSLAISIKSETQLKYPPCTINIPLLPAVEINQCDDSSEHDFSVQAHLDSSLVRKGCERSHDDTLSVYKQCGAVDVTDLLPTTNNGWVDDLIKEETVQGETNYIFDGNTAARLPKKVVGLNWESKFTLTAWILVKTAPKPQFIVSWSDGMQSGYTYMGLYVFNKGDGQKPRIGFIMHKDKGKCRFSEEWSVDLWDLRWRHVAVVVNSCNLQLLVDGDPVEPIGAVEMLKPQQTHIQPKYVIGGRWLGTHQKYTDFFNGKISQMVLSRKSIQNFRCILQCKEKLDFLSPLASGFQLETSFKDQSVFLTGRGKVSSLQKMLRGLVYSNSEPYPSAGNRIVRIETTIDTASKPAIHLEIDTRKTPGPGILLTGKCDNIMKAADTLGDAGLQVCEKIDIKVDGCLKKIEEATVIIDSDVVTNSNLSISNSLLKRFGLTSSSTTNGLRVSGSARYSDYAEVIKSLTFIPKSMAIPESFDIKIEVSAQNGRFTSNALIVEVDVKEKKTDDNTGDSFFFFDTKTGTSAGSMANGRMKNEKIKSSKSIIIFLVVSSFAIVSVVVGAATVRHMRRSRANESADSDFKPTELLWDDEGLSSINITMNPLIRFRPESNLSENTANSYEEESSEASLYWSESDEESDNDQEMKTALEWDSSYQEEFSEDFNENFDVDEAMEPSGEGSESVAPLLETKSNCNKLEESEL